MPGSLLKDDGCDRLRMLNQKNQPLRIILENTDEKT
jgi:hypothetical protein